MPFSNPTARLVMRAVFYVAILIGAWIVAKLTGGVPEVFIYQGF
jgi:hypothetical protein